MNAFNGCEGFTGDVNIPEGVEELGYAIFSGCTGLNGTITIPSTLENEQTGCLYSSTMCCVKKIVNNSSLFISLPNGNLITWIDNANPQYDITKLGRGSALKKCKAIFLVDQKIYQEQSVRTGECLKIPQTPIKDNYKFIGWYPAPSINDGSLERRVIGFSYQNDCFDTTKEWDFNKELPTGVILQARWEENGGKKSDNEIIVSVESSKDDTNGNGISDQLSNEDIILPQERNPILDSESPSRSVENNQENSNISKVEQTDMNDEYVHNREGSDIGKTDNKEPVEVRMEIANRDEIKNTLENLPIGSTLNIDMSSSNTITADILEKAKEKGIDIVLDMGSYSWIINGTEITGEQLKDVNLTVSFGQSAIPEDTIESFTGNNQYRTISLAYNGNFGFTARLRFEAGIQNVGKYVNLYYYTEDNDLEYQNSGKVAKDGFTELEFTHASEYVAIIADQIVINEEPGKTNVMSRIIVLFIILIFMVGILCLMKIRKKKS